MKQLWMDWQTFAEDAEAGQETGGETGGQTAPDAGEREAFSALIRGQYKEQFDARVQKILDGRLRDASGRCILISTGGGRWHHPGSGDW